jgi:hypothetical protein
MVAAADHGPFTEAVRAARRAQWLRAEKRAARLDLLRFAVENGIELVDVPGAPPTGLRDAGTRALPGAL